MGSEPAPAPPLVSIVVTVRNEVRHIRRLFESLLVQEPPFEVVLVDALSRDGTYEIAQEYERSHPGLFQVVRRYGSRGIGRNTGVSLAKGEFVAFIDGDCFADTQWLKSLRRRFAESDVVAGRTISVGSPQYALLERVELFQKGNDVTFPSCNLGYRRSLFLRLNGFDPRFITAEDIDLNLRAVESGAKIRFVPEAVVYHAVRPTLIRFLYQAFWNGYGRKQLTEKHGSLWGNYRISRLISNHRSTVSWLRLAAALFGYFNRVLTGGGHRLTPVSATVGAEPKAADA